MSFTANIPNTGQSLGSTQTAIRNNFTNYNTTISVNHVAPNSLGAGKHTIGEFVAQSGDPTTAATEITLYSKGTTPNVEFYIRKDSSGSVYQLTTGAPVLAGQSGSSFLPGGFIIKWITKTVNNGDTINFTTLGIGAFPNNFFTATVSINQNNATNSNATVNNGQKNTIDVYTTRSGAAHFLILIGN